ncbi:MAG TPA: heavy metal translocating P-type ATPase [Chlamydiales bacterium]|nr:heavy metal translocating P-type ATPase [Chlamydiales bacterium]
MIWAFCKRYPLPIFALFGIAVGGGFWLSKHLKEANGVWLVTLVVAGGPIVWQTVRGMLKGQFAADIVAMLAIITAGLTGEFFAGAVVVLMQSGGEAIEAYGLRRASSSLTELLKRAPSIARRKRGELIEEIDVQEVMPGDLLIVRTGELIPVDGTMTQGVGEIDESALTGEPLSQMKGVGDPLFSGTINHDGAIEMRADRISQESHYARIVQMVKRAQEEKAPIQRLADRYAVYFTPFTLLVAGIGFFLTQDVTIALSVLVVATPCPLILATPLAVICAINRAAEASIIVKGGAPIEQVASIQAALFDKTGTITFGTPVVEKIISLGTLSEKELLFRVGAIEQLSSHSLAKAIVDYALKEFHHLPLPTRFQEVAGSGVEGEIAGEFYRIGSEKWLQEKVDLTQVASYRKAGKRLIFMMSDHKCVGFIVLSDEIRPEAKTIVKKLKELGIQTIAMLTGDDRISALEVAKEAGIECVEAGLSPEGKVLRVKEYRTRYPYVLMVGDGINDAPALATATVGVAMGAHGTAISAESADIVLLADDLSKVTETIAIGKKMLKIAKQSIGIGMGLSCLLMLIALTGDIPPPLGAMLQEIIDVAVILNALRAR